MPDPRYANGTRRRKARERLKAQGLPCAICGEPIDYSLPARHPLSFEVDEIIPISKGGSPYDAANLQPAHRICNQRRGNKPMEQVKGDTPPRQFGKISTSRDW